MSRRRTVCASRRRLLRLLGGLGLLGAGGCDRLSRDARFVSMLGQAETVNARLHHLLTSAHGLAREFTEADLSPVFPSNGTHDPGTPDYRRLAARDFRDWRLRVDGLVRRPLQLSLAELRVLPARSQITRHDCVEGWSAIAKWKGARLAALLGLVQPRPEARYVVFHCADPMRSGGDFYYESLGFEDACHPQTIIAYEWNDRMLPVRYGAPVRLRVERQLGYKMAKYVMRIELVAHLGGIGGGHGGYWEDRGYAWYAGI